MTRSPTIGLADLTSDESLKAQAGESGYERGRASLAAGAVTALTADGTTVTGQVSDGDGDAYRVRLWVDKKGLRHACRCTQSEPGVLCEHGVALGLAWRHRPAPADDPDGLAALRAWLAGIPRERLTEILCEAAVNDPALRSRLDCQAAADSVGGADDTDTKDLKGLIRKALAISGFVDYRRLRGLIRRVEPLLTLISALADEGRAQLARDLAQYTFARGLAAYMRVDDSGGSFGELLREMAALFLRTCRAAPPESAAFGKQFFALMQADDWGLLDFADYAPLLGAPGLKAFTACAEKEWAKVPSYGPEHRYDRYRQTGTSYYGITMIMEALARAAGDIDRLIAIKSRDLSSPYHFLGIAEALAEAGRHDEALAWAERGQHAFTDRPDARLTAFLTAEYGRRGRHEEALALAWESWISAPTLESYQHLLACAERAANTALWRAKARAWLRADLLKPASGGRARATDGRSLLVQILLSENENAGALAEARTGGCRQDLWFQIAARCERDQPLEAADIYRQHLDAIVQRGKKSSYDYAASLTVKIGKLMHAGQRADEFAQWLTDLRARHKGRRNFLQRLAAALAAAPEAL